MNEIQVISALQGFAHSNELSESDQLLLAQAKEAAKSAHAPYSDFHVGCALLLEDGTFITGSNQENIAYPSGLCAERVALFHAGSNHPHQRIVAMAVTARSGKFEVNTPVMCCGACLQVISEFEHKQNQAIRMVLQGETGEIYVTDNGSITFMPFQFHPKELHPKQP